MRARCWSCPLLSPGCQTSRLPRCPTAHCRTRPRRWMWRWGRRQRRTRRRGRSWATCTASGSGTGRSWWTRSGGWWWGGGGVQYIKCQCLRRPQGGRIVAPARPESSVPPPGLHACRGLRHALALRDLVIDAFVPQEEVQKVCVWVCVCGGGGASWTDGGAREEGGAAAFPVAKASSLGSLMRPPRPRHAAAAASCVRCKRGNLEPAAAERRWGRQRWRQQWQQQQVGVCCDEGLASPPRLCRSSGGRCQQQQQRWRGAASSILAHA